MYEYVITFANCLHQSHQTQSVKQLDKRLKETEWTRPFPLFFISFYFLNRRVFLQCQTKGTFWKRDFHYMICKKKKTFF